MSRATGTRPLAPTSTPRRPDFSRRDAGLVELMDDPRCNAALLDATYRDFRVINALVSGWKDVYRSRIRPRLSATRENTLLDIGSGGGDIARSLARWAHRDGYRLSVTGIDPDERAYAFAASRPERPGVRFEAASSRDLVERGDRFDIVTSNHLLHHLDDAQRADLLADSEALADRFVVHSDLERSPVAYRAYQVATWPVSRRSFIHVDGLLSIRRSFRVDELARVAPTGWTVCGQKPFRVRLELDQAARRRGASHA